ncbi:hypothetical protein Vafri_20615 [Volvox africanus]|uniref:Kinesin motor domain-containing protein n=1 Tax=Volvox africanus TaxID=51714 RepID=A0A8J4FAU3_9CHLO|nr:hypothetical protein Vafri_20615 [Volvox africanus]
MDEGAFSERGLLGRNSGSVRLRSSMATSPKSKHEGEIEKVKVYARIRPALRDDETPGALVWSEDVGQLTIFRPEAPVPQSDFVFDKVLGPGASQADVYTAAVSDVVADVLRGYNGTILAYGQTGAGKTYTLGNTAPDAIGMIPRAAAELFSAAARDMLHMYRITMSYIQIYMEMIQDLLNPAADNLPIREDAGGVFVAGACEVQVTSLEECLHYLELGEQNRVFAFTHLNAHSSRSHAVVMLTAVKSRKYLSNEERAQAEAPDQDGVVTQKVTVGKLYMVDLAGSERLKKSKSVGLRATEARSINLSLTMLGMCISARAQDSPHVPFRDSKLTRLLQESLGGNAKTSLILCLSDVRQHADESLQSLQFGARASRVCNKPVVNERLQMRQLTAELLAALEEGNERTNGLEQALSQTKEERDALQAALARERARTAAIVDALRAESQAKDEQAAAKLAEQAELLSEHVQQLGHVQQQQGQLELEVAKLRTEQHVREEAHRKEVAELQQRLAELQAAATSERRAMEAEARSQHARLTAAAQQQAAALSSQLAQERAAAREHAASIHLALTRLQRALGELVSMPSTLEDGCGGGGGNANGSYARNYAEAPAVEIEEGSSGGRMPHRPAWVRAGLAAAAAAAASRLGSRVSTGSGCGDGVAISSSGGSGRAVQMIQAALGLTGSASDGEGFGEVNPATASRGEGNLDGSNATGPTAAAIAVLVGASGGGSSATDGGRRLRHSQSMGAGYTISGSLRDQRLGEYGESGFGAMSGASANSARSQGGRRATASGGPLPLAGPSPRSQHHQQQQPASVGSAGWASSPSIGLHSSEIADIDAALAAAQQDLIEDFRAVAAMPGSVFGIGRGSAQASRSLNDHAHNVSHVMGSQPPSAAPATSMFTADGCGNGRQSSPYRNRSSGGGGGGGGVTVSGGYAAEYAAAVANGMPSPGRQSWSYYPLHTGGGGGAPNGTAAKLPRGHGHSADSGSALGGGLLNEASCGSVGGGVGVGVNDGGDSAYRAGGAGRAIPSATGHSLPNPFMDQGGRHAATAASPPSTSRYVSPAGGGGGGGGGGADSDIAMRQCSGIINVNPAFDAGDSEGVKSEDVLAAMSAAGLSFSSYVAAAPGSSAATANGGECSATAAAAAVLSRERRSSDAAGGGCGGLLAPSPTLAVPPPPLPLFTGIQVQLDALLDIAAVLKRVKTGLEARAMAQACELARMHEEQQQTRSGLQTSRSALEVAESQLAITTQELDAIQMVLKETVGELGWTRRELNERSADLDEARRKLDDMAGLYDSALMRLGETRGRLDEALGQLEDQGQEMARLSSELEMTKADLASERSALARIRAAAARSVAMTTQALAARHELQRQVRAANMIKAAYKRYKVAQLRGQVAAKHQALRDAEMYRREREALQAARAGQALVQESVGVIRDAVGSILAAFVGRRYQLEARKSLQDRMERMFSQGGSGSGSSKMSASNTSKLPIAGFPSTAGRPLSLGGASSTGGAAGPGAGSRSLGGGIPPPLTPAGGRRQMSSPLGLTMMLSAVTLPPLTPASASTTTSTGRPAASADGGAGYAGRLRTHGFPPPSLQLPDDTATSTSWGTPKRSVPEGSIGNASVARSSSGGAAGTGAGAAVNVSSPGVKTTSSGNGGSANRAVVDAPRTTCSAATYSSEGRVAGTATCTPVDTPVGAAAAGVHDRDDVVSPANGHPCSSSSSCSGAVAIGGDSIHNEVMSKAAVAAVGSAE